MTARHEKLALLIQATDKKLAVVERQAAEVEANVNRALAAVAADASEDLLSDADAAERRAASTAEQAAARERVTELRRALPELRARHAVAAEQHRQTQVAAARKAHARAQQASATASKALGTNLRATGHAARELVRYRNLTDAAERDLAALLTADDGPVDLVDEDWRATPDLLDLLTAGPRQPIADAARRSADERASAAHADEEVLAWFRRHAAAGASRVA